jgi:3-hydroxyisobutyrate dehydrogenase-like beta-hydroxyacid dehydrogenase
MDEQTIGLVGTGNMGRRMGLRLIAAGHRLIVNDAFKAAAEPLIAKGATWAESPKAAAQQARIVLTSLPGPKEIEAVVTGTNGVLAGAKAGDLLIEMSTNSPQLVKRLAATAQANGVRFLEAPVAGGTKGAEDGTLTIMTGGDAAVLESAKPVLDLLGKRVIHMGEPGAGNATKLINNLLGMASIYAIAEAMTLGAKAGLDPQRLYAVLESGPVSNLILTNVYKSRAFKGDFAPAFALDLATKDQGLVVQLGDDLGAPMHLGKMLLAQYEAARRSGLGGEDFTAVIKPLEEKLGVQVRL